MSYDKNTLDFSEIDTIVRVLDYLAKADGGEQRYVLTELGTVEGLGVNDEGPHILRSLWHSNITVVEQMQRTCDCDADDVIVSIETHDGDDMLPLETMMCVCGGCDV